MTTFRTPITDFQLANPIYIGASVTFYTVDGSGDATTTLATLYAGPVGATTLANPQRLDSYGKFSAPVYFDEANGVIAEAVGPNVPSHRTGIISISDGNNIIASLTSGGVIFASSASTLACSALLAQYRLVYGGGAGAAPATLGSLGTTTTVLHGNAAGLPTWGPVSLTADVSGILPGANGGTGVANTGKTFTIGGSFTISGAFTTTLTVTANTSLTLPTSGTLATRAGTETLTAKSMSGASNTFTNIGGTSIRMGSDAQGDLLYFNGTNYVRLAAGTSGSSLKTLGASANPAWVMKGFRAHNNSVDQAGIAAATYTKVTFGSEFFDLGSHFDTTNSRWTPPAGLVQLNGTILVGAGAQSAGTYVAKIIKNGSADVAAGTGTAVVGLTTLAVCSVSCVDQANGTDYYELWFYGDSAGNLTIQHNPAHTHFSGHVV